METLYQTRLRRYVTAMRGGMPDMIPIRPFVAEITGNYAGYNCQQLTHDYENAFAAARKCAADFDWDAVVANMVYGWTGLTEAIGLKYYAVPGIQIPATTGFQYREPPENHAFMEPEEYDALIEDPTGFLLNVWLPRVAAPVRAPGQPNTLQNNLSFLKGGMAMLKYFMGFGTQNARLRAESGTVSAISGIFKAPMDIIADKLRGYLGLVEDLFVRRDKVLAACEALMPHLYQVARSGADPSKLVPIGYWMHRGGVPFVSPDVFENVYWATTKPIIEELWAEGHQTLCYAEGKWDFHLDTIAKLPARSIVYHCDMGDIFLCKKKLGDKFCLSGGVPNVMLAFGSPSQVREHVKKVIEGVAPGGGYIMDANAIVQNDAKIENLKAMTEATREFGVYSGGRLDPLPADTGEGFKPSSDPRLHPSENGSTRMPGACWPWREKRAEYPAQIADEPLQRRVWEDVDSLAYTYIWQVLLSF